MKIYLVGGAIRDKLLGLEPKEKDWVVINSSPQELLNLGYKQVGKDFPVFLNPHTTEEYALARKERKVNKGHQGFEFDISSIVTLEQDLLRRDLTINAIAQDEEGGLIDPYNGIADIENKVLRHVSEAFTEDPLRVFRLARFYAKLYSYNFNIHDSTYKIIERIVNSGEIETLSPERLWGELSKAFNTPDPWMFFEVLIKSKVAEKYIPEILHNNLLKEKILFFSKKNIEKNMFLSIAGFSNNFVTLFGFPKKILDIYFMYNEFQPKFFSLQMQSEKILSFLNTLDAFRRPERLKIFLKQIKYSTNFSQINKDLKLSIFFELSEIIEKKINYGDLINIEVEKIKRKIEKINLNLISSVLSKKI